MPLWNYSYKTPDGVRHEGCIRSVSRDGVYDALRRQGIKPIKVELAPGRVNRLLSLGMRGWSVVLLILLVMGLLVALGRAHTRHRPAGEAMVPRHRVEHLPDGWIQERVRHWGRANAFLVLFSQPGSLEFESIDGADAFTETALREENTTVRTSAPKWVKEIDEILAGMREEALVLFKMGKRPEEIVLWLKERQRMEAAYRRQVLEGEGTDAAKRKRLEAMGL